MERVLGFLDTNQIEYQLHRHAAVFTVEEAEKHRGEIKGMACKNLFLRDQKKKHFYLLTLPAQKKLNLKEFFKTANTGKLSFGGPELLHDKLGLEAGSVSPFGLINDVNVEVIYFIDAEVFNAEMVSFHPNDNTATLALTKAMFHKYLDAIPHRAKVIKL